MTLPLDDILVADFSRVLAGPLVAMTLGDLGAEVIKVESPDGDDTRSWKPPADAAGRATYHHAANRNKRSIVLDLKTDVDVALARRLCERADVVSRIFDPGPSSASASATTMSRHGTRRWSTARSAASVTAWASTYPATTRSCKRSAA